MEQGMVRMDGDVVILFGRMHDREANAEFGGFDISWPNPHQ